MKHKIQKIYHQFIAFAKTEIKKTMEVVKSYMFSKDIEIPPISVVSNPDDSYKIFQTQAHTSTHLLREIKPATNFGLKVIAVAVFIFIIWGGLAPLKSYAPAPGNIVLSGKRKIVQHLEGGIIKEIRVKEGEHVKEGQILLVLQDTQAKARSSAFSTQTLTYLATEARLIAERDHKDHIDFPKELLESKDPEVTKAIENQKQQFESRRTTLLGQIDVLKQRIHQAEESIAGTEAQLQATENQIKINAEDRKAHEKLLTKGLARKSDILRLQQQTEQLEGQKGEQKARVAGLRQQIGESQIQILNLENDFAEKVNALLEQTQLRLSDARENLKSTKDVLERTVVRAPAAGIVTHLQFHTIGGVIPPNQQIMEIIPQNDTLLVEGTLLPKDIEGVHAGMEAIINLSAYKSRLVPKVNGKVVYVSPDVHQDPRPQYPQPGTQYYVIRVEVPQKELSRLNHKVTLYPGMPADIFIVTGARTMLQYLLSPILESFSKAFIEK